MIKMKKIQLLLLFPLLLLAKSPFESVEKNRNFDLSVFNTKSIKLNTMASKNPKIRCRWVCDKKVYKEQEIEEAISFYKNSKDYSFKDAE